MTATRIPCTASLAFAAALALACPALAQPVCQGYSAYLEGARTSSAAGAELTTRHRLLMHKRDGAGLAGEWVGTVYQQTLHSSTALSRAQMHNLSETPVNTLPGVNVTCATAMPDAQTMVVRCMGAYPLEIDEAGNVFWQGQTTPIGTVDPARDTAPAEITLDLLKGVPADTGPERTAAPMTGTIQDATGFGLAPRLHQTGPSDPDAFSPWSELQVILGPDKSALGTMGNLAVSAFFNSAGGAPGWNMFQTPAQVTLTVRLPGPPAARRALAANFHVSATAVVDGCRVNGNWTLLDLALLAGVTP